MLIYILKKRLVLTGLILCSFQFVYCQQKTLLHAYEKQRHAYAYDLLKINPLALLCGPTMVSSELGLMYETSISQKQSLSIGASWLAKNIFIYLGESSLTLPGVSSNQSVTYTTPDLKISGWRVQGHYKFVFPVFGNYPTALHVGPHASFSSILLGDSYNGFDANYYRIVHRNISVLFGFQFKASDRIFFDIYHGMGYKNNYWGFHKTPDQFKMEEDVFFFTGNHLNIKFSLGFNIGFLL